MALGIGLALVGLCLLVVAGPFFRKKDEPSRGSDPILDLRKRRSAVYDEVRVLHNDHMLGHVPQDQYERRLQPHRLLAATLLREEERLRALDSRLEEDILHLRIDTGDATACPHCGHQADHEVAECPACGAMLSGQRSGRLRPNNA